MNIKRKELVEALECVYPAIGTNALLPVFQNIKVSGKTVEGTDGSIKIETQLSQDIEMEFCVNGSGFLGLLRSLRCEDINIELKGNMLHVLTSKLEGNFKLTENAKFPRIQFSEEVAGLEDPEGLSLALSMCKLGVSQDETAGVLCGVMFTPAGEGENTYLYSSDRFRILRAKWNNPYTKPFSLPIKFIDILQKVMNKVILMDFTGERFQVELEDGTKMSTLVYGGEFRDLGIFFPGEDAANVVIGFDDEFKDIFNRHTQFVKGMDMVDKEISIHISEGVCRLKHMPISWASWKRKPVLTLKKRLCST